MSILATALEVEPLSTAALIYVNRRTSSIMFLEELEDLKDRFPERFQLVHVLGQEPTEVDLLSGRLDVDRLDRILDTILPVEDVDEWFLCGPLAMTDIVRGVLLARHVVPRRCTANCSMSVPRSPADFGPQPDCPGHRIRCHRHPGRPVADLTLRPDGDSVLGPPCGPARCAVRL